MTPCELREGEAPDRTAHDLANQIMKEQLAEELREEQGDDDDGE